MITFDELLTQYPWANYIALAPDFTTVVFDTQPTKGEDGWRGGTQSEVIPNTLHDNRSTDWRKTLHRINREDRQTLEPIA